MRVLIDECAPKALKVFLSKHGHKSLTVQEAGWAGKENGELLALAENRFDALITVDTNLRFQQNLKGRKIGIIVLQCSSNRLAALRPLFPACARALKKLQHGQVIQIAGSHLTAGRGSAGVP